MEKLQELYKEATGHLPLVTEQIAGAGSPRTYYRMKSADGQTLIGVVGTSPEENNAFCYLARHFAAHQLPVPHIIAQSTDGMRYLQTDLGSQSLYDALKQGREQAGQYNQHETELLHRAIKVLPPLQVLGAEGLDFTQCYPQEALDETNVHFDLNYFKYCYLKTTHIDFHELKLEQSFRDMAHDLAAIHSNTFMHRDYQARNIMLDTQGNPHIIDFQGGRRGPLEYDLASFLWQAAAQYPHQLRQELTDTYLSTLRRYQAVDTHLFHQRLQLCTLFRTLQVLGAYGFRGRIEQKPHFLHSTTYAIQNLKTLLLQGQCPYTYLNQILHQVVEAATEHNTPKAETDKPHSLLVSINSFSYRQGLPKDNSGNGGGYIFDCRSMHNPGRYQPYKQLTGLDEPVIKFLEKEGEVQKYLEHVYALADSHVENYLERNFTNLMFSFGCTGGRHRSVYCAQHLAEHLHDKYGIAIHLCHREQGQTTDFPRRSAMILAAGKGTRLKPLTDSTPKALIPVGHKPLLQHQFEKLKAAGIRHVIVNTHHLADQVEQWCQQHPMGMQIHISEEHQELLDTGGAIKHAASHLIGAQDGIIVHNVDILSNADLPALLRAAQGTSATLLVSQRPTQRYLLFDNNMKLVGWTNTATHQVKSPFPHLDPTHCHHYAFSGIHVISQKLFPHFADFPSRFSIIDFYLSLCAEHPIYGHIQPDLRLLDVGKPDTLAIAQRQSIENS